MSAAAVIDGDLVGRPALRPKRDVFLIVAVTVFAALAVVAAFAPLIAPYSPNDIDTLAIEQGPSGAHIFGTDGLGRDIFSRIVYGARLSLLGPALVTLIATVLGTSLALAGAWLGGWPDRLIMRSLDILFAFPSILFALLAVVAFGTGLWAPVIALSIAYTPYIARVVHSVAVRERQLPYIESFQMLGFSAWRTVLRHLLRNVRLFIVAQSTITYGYALLDLAAVSFIGLGVQAPTAEWGLMVSDGASSVLNGSIQTSLAAGLAIVLTVVSVNVIGERFTVRSERGR